MTAPEVTVAVLDDDARVREVVCLALAEAGYRTLGLPQTCVALGRLRAVGPAAVVLDVQDEPGDRGLALLRRLRAGAATRAVPVVAMSVDGHRSVARARFLAAGCAAVIGKPFDLNELWSAVVATQPVGQPRGAAD